METIKVCFPSRLQSARGFEGPAILRLAKGSIAIAAYSLELVSYRLPAPGLQDGAPTAPKLCRPCQTSWLMSQ